jgi:peptidoglycan/xylan/chitin deacetylase (PgdA/CDA1 family)
MTNQGAMSLRRTARVAALAALAIASFAMPVTASAADAPGGCSSNAAARTKNAWLTDTIASSTDVDWFRFSVSTGTRAIVTLGNLPANYELRVYSGCSTLEGSSNRSGRQFEDVFAYFPAGTYFARVSGVGGTSSAATYALRFRTLAWGLPILSSTTWTDAAGYLHVAGEVLNNTAEPRRWVEIDASLLNGDGAVMGSAVGYPDIPTLAPWSRSPFEIVTRKPAGYARLTLRICTPNGAGGCATGQVATAPLGGLTVAAAPSFLDAAGRRHYVGSIRNDRASTARGVLAHVTIYDAYGNVRGLAVGPAGSGSGSIVPGTSAGYEIIGSGSASPNRYVSVASGGSTGCSNGPRYVGAQENLVPPLARSSATGRVALTFDMGGRMTPAVKILNLLVANRVCATIFPTGAISRTAEGQAALGVVKAHPELFELGNHTMNHCDLVRGGGGAPGATESAYCRSLGTSPTETQVKKELTDGEHWITYYAGMSVQPFWRAPYGAHNLTIRTWAAEVGYTKHWKWDIDTIDWRPIADGGPTARSMALKVVNSAKSGSVVLLHLGGYETADALQAMIDGLRSRGFVLTTLSDIAQ